MLPLQVAPGYNSREIFDPIQEKLRGHLQASELEAIAGQAAEQVALVFPDADKTPQEITAENWLDLVDASQPTIGIHPASLVDAPLLAAASQRLRSRGEQSCNIVLLPHPLYGKEAVSATSCFAEWGVLIDAQGNTYVGQFPVPLQLDAMNGEGALPQTHTRTMQFINTPREQRLLQDKRKLHKRFARNSNIHTASLLDTWHPGEEPVPAHLPHLINQYGGVVTKPNGGSLGSGVLLHVRELTTDEAAMNACRRMYGRNQTVLFEQWIESLPLHHAQTGTRLDWNIRLLIAGGYAVGSYARVARFGGPVNISQGAQRRRLRDVLSDCGLNTNQQAALHARLDDLAGDTFFEVPANFMGADIIINKELQPVVVEVNDERAGGISSISMLAGSVADKLETPEAIVRHWRHTMFGDFRRQPPGRKRQVPVRADDELLFQELVTLSGYDTELEALAAETAKKLVGRVHTPRKLRKMGREYLRTLTEQPEAAQPGPALHTLKILGAASLKGAHCAGYRKSFAQRLRREPSSVSAREQLARTFLPDQLTRKTIYLLGSHAETQESALALGTAIVWQVLRVAGTDPFGVPLAVCRKLELAVAGDLYNHDKYTRRLVTQLHELQRQLNPREQENLRPAIDVLTILRLLASADYAAVAARLPDLDTDNPAGLQTLRLVRACLIPPLSTAAHQTHMHNVAAH